MGIRDRLFKWIKTKDKDGNALNLGYVLDGEPKTMEDLEKVFRAYGLEAKFHLFKPLIRSKIDIELIPSNDEMLKIGRSKFGGRPDLENGVVWPKTNLNKSLSFIAQLNCGEISLFDNESLLPGEGLISFFYCADQEAWGFDPKDKDRFKILYTKNISGLKRVDFPKDLEEHSIFPPNELEFDNSLSLPGWEHDSIDDILSDDETDNYIKISSGCENQILGYADCVQGPMELECQLVTNGLYCGDPSGHNDPRRQALENGKEDWVLLLQIDSDDDNDGMMWGDMGKLYYWIRKQDLREQDFDSGWFILQCH